MKTLKTKVSGKPKKTSKTITTKKSKNVTSVKGIPTEDEIRNKAQEIYELRKSRGEQGNALDDWHKAEEFFSGSRRKTKK